MIDKRRKIPLIAQLLFKGQLTAQARLLVAGAGVAMLAAIFLPLWQMTMISNQYPEGLRMWIYSYTITGDLQEINTLNHYIGMHPLDAEHFAELRILPYSFALGGLLCLLAAALRRRLITTVVLLGGLVSGIGSMSILLYELYTYGHDLDAKAAIEIEPFMPPPIGSNQLANFQVTSFFHAGSILFILAIGLLAAALWISRPRVSNDRARVAGHESQAPVVR
jgi:copper chaperone NosL